MRKLILALCVIGVIATTAFAMSPKAPPASALVPPAPIDPDAVWIGKSDEAKSCEKKRGIALDEMAAQLSQASIKILAKRKLHDGQMRIQQCGTDKGDMNGFLVAKKDVEQAKALGFKTVPAPPSLD